MHSSNPITLFDLRLWTGGSGEDKVSYHFVDGDLKVKIRYDDLVDGTSKFLYLIFEQVHDMRLKSTPGAGKSNVIYAAHSDGLMGVVVEYLNSEAADAWSDYWNSVYKSYNTERAVKVRDFLVDFGNENVCLSVYARDCRIEYKHMDARALKELSKVVSHALRHEPWLYELEIDAEGWASMESVLAALRAERPDWSAISQADLVAMIEQSDKQRHEIDSERIRALYGHSLPTKISRSPAQPPEVLFHGTSPSALTQIMSTGLLPMNRQYVHLSVDEPTAIAVGKRKSDQPVILRVQARQASENGILFYQGNDKVWLASEVPAKHIVVPG